MCKSCYNGILKTLQEVLLYVTCLPITVHAHRKPKLEYDLKHSRQTKCGLVPEIL